MKDIKRYIADKLDFLKIIVVHLLGFGTPVGVGSAKILPDFKKFNKICMIFAERERERERESNSILSHASIKTFFPICQSRSIVSIQCCGFFYAPPANSYIVLKTYNLIIINNI